MRLSELQERVLALLARDMTVREMAAELGYSMVWVYHELQALRETLGVRTNWGRWWRRCGWGWCKWRRQQDSIYTRPGIVVDWQQGAVAADAWAFVAIFRLWTSTTRWASVG
jgi:hypothetical protein